jgi:hypothetical protein
LVHPGIVKLPSVSIILYANRYQGKLTHSVVFYLVKGSYYC